MTKIPWSRVKAEPINSEEDYEALLKRHKEIHNNPNGNPVFPTHVLKVDGEIAGCFSIQSPTIHFSMDKEMMDVRDTVSMWTAIEAILLDRGIKHYVIPVEKTSPMYEIAEKRLNKITGTDNCTDFNLFERSI